MQESNKTIQIEKLDFDQLYSYIQQVLETANDIKKIYKKKLDITDILNALSIHSGILEEYIQQLINRYNVRDLPNINNPK